MLKSLTHVVSVPHSCHASYAPRCQPYLCTSLALLHSPTFLISKSSLHTHQPTTLVCAHCHPTQRPHLPCTRPLPAPHSHSITCPLPSPAPPLSSRCCRYAHDSRVQGVMAKMNRLQAVLKANGNPQARGGGGGGGGAVDCLTSVPWVLQRARRPCIQKVGRSGCTSLFVA